MWMFSWRCPGSSTRSGYYAPVEIVSDPLRELGERLSEAAGQPVTLERPAKAEHGDYATNVALQAAAQAGRAPRELAQELAERVTELGAVERAEVAGPGFLNLFLSRAWFADTLGGIL